MRWSERELQGRKERRKKGEDRGSEGKRRLEQEVERREGRKERNFISLWGEDNLKKRMPQVAQLPFSLVHSRFLA